jgi:hypothetical protein
MPQKSPVQRRLLHHIAEQEHRHQLLCLHLELLDEGMVRRKEKRRHGDLCWIVKLGLSESNYNTPLGNGNRT